MNTRKTIQASAATKKPLRPSKPVSATTAKSPVPKAEPEQKVAAKKAPVARVKLVRDSFTMPQADFDIVAVLKARALDLKRPAKKSELLRAGLHALAGLEPVALKQALDALTPLKTGRPKKAG